MHIRFGGKPTTLISTFRKWVYRKVFDYMLIKHARFLHAQSRFESSLANAQTRAKIIVSPNGVDDSWLTLMPRCYPAINEELRLLFLG